MKNELDIRRRIMNRVWGIYLWRQVAQPTVRAVIFLSACLAVTSVVSVKNVIANVMGMPSVARISEFFLSAFVQTEFVVQVGLILATLVIAWSAVDVIRSRVHAPAHA